MATIYNGARGAGLAVILQNNCCLGCMLEFETSLWDTHYLFISGVCNPTVCRCCLDARVEAERGLTASWRDGCICCPICEVDRAFNMRKLVKNMALANVLAEIRRLMDRQPDNGDDGHSNSGVEPDYKDEGTKRKRREE